MSKFIIKSHYVFVIFTLLSHTAQSSLKTIRELKQAEQQALPPSRHTQSNTEPQSPESEPHSPELRSPRTDITRKTSELNISKFYIRKQQDDRLTNQNQEKSLEEESLETRQLYSNKELIDSLLRRTQTINESNTDKPRNFFDGPVNFNEERCPGAKQYFTNHTALQQAYECMQTADQRQQAAKNELDTLSMQEQLLSRTPQAGRPRLTKLHRELTEQISVANQAYKQACYQHQQAIQDLEIKRSKYYEATQQQPRTTNASHKYTILGLVLTSLGRAIPATSPIATNPSISSNSPLQEDQHSPVVDSSRPSPQTEQDHFDRATPYPYIESPRYSSKYFNQHFNQTF